MAGGPSRPSLLFISPIRPRPSGNGLAMRGWEIAQALGRRYEVVVAVPGEKGVPLRERIRRALYAKRPQLYTRLYSVPGHWPSEFLSAATNSAACDIVHVFRHYMAPYAEPYLGKLPCQLDLDESEARTRAKLAALCRRNGQNRQAALLEWECAFFRQAERAWLPRFERLFVSSPQEREYLLGLGLGLQPLVLPNSVTVPEPSDPPPSGTPFTFLFVGNLNYYPNADALRFFVREILPLIRQRTTNRFRVTIAGAGPGDLRKLLRGVRDVEWLGFAKDLTPYYRESHAVIVPLRAGGGTRIKIIEAFAHRRPVVATTMGSEGLEVVPGRHFLCADTPVEFAEACIRLMQDPGSGTRIAAAAFNLVVSRYGSASLDAVLNRR